MGRACSQNGRRQECFQNFNRKRTGMRLFRRPRRRIIMDVKEIGVSERNMIDSTQDREYWIAPVDAALNPVSISHKLLSSPNYAQCQWLYFTAEQGQLRNLSPLNMCLPDAFLSLLDSTIKCTVRMYFNSLNFSDLLTRLKTYVCPFQGKRCWIKLAF